MRQGLLATMLVCALAFAPAVARAQDATGTTITGGPSGFTTNHNASFTFQANAPATFECSLDNAPYTGCNSPAGYANLAEGSHTFSVRAVDASGVPDPNPATRSWIIGSAATQDLVGPRVVVTTKVATMSRDGIVGVRISCPRSEPDICGGTMRLYFGSVVLASRDYPLGRGQSKTVKLRLPLSKRNIVLTKRHLRVTVFVRATDLASNVRVTRARMTLNAPAGVPAPTATTKS